MAIIDQSNITQWFREEFKIFTDPCNLRSISLLKLCDETKLLQ